MEVKEVDCKGKKVVNDLQSKKSPKRKKWEKEYENVNVKNNDDKVRKVSKEYPVGLRRLPTRMNPRRISTTMKVMSPIHKNGIVCMGFGSLLNIDMDNTLGLLNYYLLDQCDPESSCRVLENYMITITKDTMHECWGYQMMGKTSC
ncbi:unnamed protein product [Lactuca saligna]|uniref:Uncharacterized protein n=1 Tax=Lactuca saligna TaxID=75948 RepID=A0AA35YV60_LACSI|nr:unnamed protein product [Lactuca saligna]